VRPLGIPIESHEPNLKSLAQVVLEEKGEREVEKMEGRGGRRGEGGKGGKWDPIKFGKKSMPVFINLLRI